jgi:hypothetical protein
MQHVIMTCLNHRNLRWSCKEIAVTKDGKYNGCRNIFFCGTVEQIAANQPENMNDECNCPSEDLRSLKSLEIV